MIDFPEGTGLDLDFPYHPTIFWSDDEHIYISGKVGRIGEWKLSNMDDPTYSPVGPAYVIIKIYKINTERKKVVDSKKFAFLGDAGDYYRVEDFIRKDKKVLFIIREIFGRRKAYKLIKTDEDLSGDIECFPIIKGILVNYDKEKERSEISTNLDYPLYEIKWKDIELNEHEESFDLNELEEFDCSVDLREVLDSLIIKHPLND